MTFLAALAALLRCTLALSVDQRSDVSVDSFTFRDERFDLLNVQCSHLLPK